MERKEKGFWKFFDRLLTARSDHKSTMNKSRGKKDRRGGVKPRFFLVGFASLICLVSISCSRAAPERELEIREKKLVSIKPPFTLMLPSEFQLVHFSSMEYPKENSVTRSYFLIKEKDKQVEEMLIVQIADRTNPQAEPISAPPLKPDLEKRMYLKEKIRKGELIIDSMIQLITWNPEAASLQPVVKKKVVIPSHLALQGQFLFVHRGEHAVFIRYSKDVHSFRVKISEDGGDWERNSISGNERKVYETFRKTCTDMIHSIIISPV
jgi:hypothetical protein